VSCVRTAELTDLPFGLWTQRAKGSTSSIVFARWCQWQGILAPPGGYNWTARLRWRCSRMSNYFDHLLILHAAVKCASCAVHRDNKTYTHTYVKVAYYCARQLTTTTAILICKLVFNFNLITLMHKNSEPQYTDTQHTTTDQVRMVFRDVASNFCLGSPKRTIHFLTMTQVWNLSNRGMGRRGGLDWAGFNVPLNTL